MADEDDWTCLERMVRISTRTAWLSHLTAYRTINSSILQLLHEAFSMVGQSGPVGLLQATVVAVRHNTGAFEMLGQKIIEPHRMSFSILPGPERVPCKSRNGNDAGYVSVLDNARGYVMTQTLR
jgi:hypothetical protein